MPDKQQHSDLTERASESNDEKGTGLAQQVESDDVFDESGLANTPSPEGDSAGENRVTTSLSDD